MSRSNRDPVNHCRSCGASVVWLEGEHGGKKMIVDASAEAIRRARAGERFEARDKRLVSHFATCPDAARWRQKPRKEDQHGDRSSRVPAPV